MQIQDSVSLYVENVGGIDETRIEFSSGVTVLTGRNATNRTSLLQAIMAALGSDRISLKADADEGKVELTVDGDEYTRRLRREDGDVVTDGRPYLRNSELADLFAFLLRENEARRAVARSEDLRDIIMRPIDTDEIQREIDRLLDRKGSVEERLEELEELRDERVGLERERERLESELEETRERLDEKRAEIEATNGDISDIREEKSALEEKLGDLGDARSELEEVRYSIETERESLASLREERSDLEAELEELEEAAVDDLEELDGRLERLRGRLETLDSTINELQNVIRFNEETLEGDVGLFGDVVDEGDDVPERLTADGRTVKCWTCGSEVEERAIGETLDRLRSLRQRKFERRSEVNDEIDELRSERREHERRRERRESLRRDLEEVEAEIDERRERLESLEDERDALESRIDELEASVESLQDRSYSEIFDLHKEANQLEFELERKREELDDTETALEEIETRLEERGDLQDSREAIDEELEDLRTRVDSIEKRAVEQFNTHMENVLETLDYENIERIWIERTRREVRDGRRNVSESAFQLHVVRATESGATYEDTIDHLSESEREVTGLVFALAGYLVHEVYEDVPFILLDSLEAIDSERIANLVGYLSKYADKLVVALLPEDAAALPEEYQRITDI